VWKIRPHPKKKSVDKFGRLWYNNIIKGKVVIIMTREQQIEQYMKSLQISREEAEQLYEDDQEDYIGEEGEQMTEKAKEIRRYEQSAEKKERKPREKKLDEDKVKIISFLQRVVTDSDALNVVIKNEQREITFTYNGAEYSLTLTKHRPPKK
jgi:3-isopropylmalate dehydratase small subunit